MTVIKKALYALRPIMARPYGRLGTYLGLSPYGWALVNLYGTNEVYPLLPDETVKVHSSCTVGDVVVLTKSSDPFFRYALRECLPKNKAGAI